MTREEFAKLKVGDKVKIKDDACGSHFASLMDKYRGEVLTIKRIDINDNGMWFNTEEAVSPITYEDYKHHWIFSYDNIDHVVETAAESIGLRPCKVGDKKGWFHMWIEVEDAYLRIPLGWSRSEKVVQIKKNFDEHGVVPESVKVETLTNTFGLIEFEDGTVDNVKPNNIIFLDSKEVTEK